MVIHKTDIPINQVMMTNIKFRSGHFNLTTRNVWFSTFFRQQSSTSLEVLAIKIRDNKQIGGLKIVNIENKLSQSCSMVQNCHYKKVWKN